MQITGFAPLPLQDPPPPYNLPLHDPPPYNLLQPESLDIIQLPHKITFPRVCLSVESVWLSVITMSPLLYLIIPPLPILLCPAHFVIPSFCIVRTAESQNVTDVNSVNMYNVHSIFFLLIFTFHMTATTWIAKQFQQNEKVYNQYRNHFFIHSKFYTILCNILSDFSFFVKASFNLQKKV